MANARARRPAPSTGDLFADGSAPTPSDTVARLRHSDPAQWAAHADWQPVLRRFWATPQGLQLTRFLQTRLEAGAVVYPSEPLRALALSPLASVRVVILGQDPYHGPHQAEGLAFSVAPGVRVPPSLRNIFKELHRDLGQAVPSQGSLQAWARRGALLLNTSLTVEDGQPASHARQGWESLTDALLVEVAKTVPCCVYLLWGAHAQAKAPLVRAQALSAGTEALVLEANHPSPLSASRGPTPFLGCGHFSQAQQWLRARGVDWRWSL